MLAALKEIVDLNSLLFIANHEDCPQCQKTGWIPSPNGRQCLHRHDELTLRVIPLLGVILREYCKGFKTDNDGLIHVILHGLQALGVLPRSFHLPDAFDAVADSQQPNDQEPSLIKAKEENPEEEIDKGPDLWTPLAEPLKERVSEKNFEVWLSSVRFFSSDESRLVLHVPNTFFQEYLAEHYFEVIEEELYKTGSQKKVFFEVGPTLQEPITTPKEPAPAVQEEAVVLPPLSPKEEIRIRRRLQAREEATSRKSGLNHKLLASLLAVIEAAEAQEDRREQEQQKAEFKDARREQWAKPSSWWSDDKTPKKIRQLAEQIDRNEKKGTNKPKRE